MVDPVRISPLSGDTQVLVETDGDVKICSCGTSSDNPRPRPIKLAGTKRSVMQSSPQGLMRTVKIVLPAGEATEETVLHEVIDLFDKYKNSKSKQYGI